MRCVVVEQFMITRPPRAVEIHKGCWAFDVIIEAGSMQVRKNSLRPTCSKCVKSARLGLAQKVLNSSRQRRAYL